MNTLVSQPLRVPPPSAIMPATVLAEPLLGAWINSNSFARDLVKVVLTSSGASLIVEAFGTYAPAPRHCGVANGIAYSSTFGFAPAVAFTVQYSFDGAHVILIGHLQGRKLLVETFTQFTDGSGRANLYSVDTLSR